MVIIQVQNVSTMLADADLATILIAITHQCNEDLAPVWGTQQVQFHVIAKNAKFDPNSWQFVVADNSDQADALGYHDISSQDQAIGFAFVKTTMDDGGQVSVTISHEILEMMCDAHIATCNQSSDTEFDAQESCDPVEDDSLGYKKAGVLVSDFITPAWFQPGVSGPYDFMKHLSAPLSLAPGGYRSFWTPSTGWTQQTDMRKVPSARHKMTAFSRRTRRVQRTAK